MSKGYIIKPSAHAWFLEIASVQEVGIHVWVFVCVFTPKGY